MSRAYDSSEANSLLGKIDSNVTLASNINVSSYKSLQGSLCNKTKTILSSGSFSEYIQDPSKIVGELEDISTYLSSSIALFNDIDGSGGVSEDTKSKMNGIMDKFYTQKYGDMYVNLDGVPYVLLSQAGHSTGDSAETSEPPDSPLYTEYFLFTDGDPGSKNSGLPGLGKGTSLAGASCSFCSTINCIIAEKGYDYVMDQTGARKYFDYYYEKTGSMNSASLAAINRAYTEDWLSACDPRVDYSSLSPNARIMRDNYVTKGDMSVDKVEYWRGLTAEGHVPAYSADSKKEYGQIIPGNYLFTNSNDKPRGIDTFVDSYFGGGVTSITRDYSSSGFTRPKAEATVKGELAKKGITTDMTFDEMVDKGYVKMVIRMPSNSSSSARYKSGAGHYIASVSFDQVNTNYFTILDSAIDIDTRQASALDLSKNRIGAVPVDFFTKGQGKPKGVIYIIDEDRLRRDAA